MRRAQPRTPRAAMGILAAWVLQEEARPEVHSPPGAAEAERPSALGRMANDLAQPHAAICAQQAFVKMQLHTKRFMWHGWGTQHVEQVALHALHWCC